MMPVPVRPHSVAGMSSGNSSHALKAAHSSDWLLVGVGAVSIVVGVLALVYPEMILLALALIAGINVFLFGLLGIVSAVSAGGGNAGARVLVALVPAARSVHPVRRSEASQERCPRSGGVLNR
jgi:hypothetical protein